MGRLPCNPSNCLLCLSYIPLSKTKCSICSGLLRNAHDADLSPKIFLSKFFLLWSPSVPLDKGHIPENWFLSSKMVPIFHRSHPNDKYMLSVIYPCVLLENVFVPTQTEFRPCMKPWTEANFIRCIVLNRKNFSL